MRHDHAQGGEAAGMNGTIICAVDGSEGAEAAIRIADRLGVRLGSRVVVVSVTAGTGDAAERQATAAAALLERLAAERRGPDAREYRVEVGSPVETLADIAADEAAELIVVGARRGFRKRTLRSELARELAETAPCPVLVAPPESSVAGAPHALDGRRAR